MKTPWFTARRRPAPHSGVEAQPEGFHQIRFRGGDDQRVAKRAVGMAPRTSLFSTPTLRVLTLSGGGAGGAFGAGALVGLTEAGKRPDFDMVTGVSTGALIAPYAFAGPDWDERLRDAYTGRRTAEILGLKAIRPGQGLYAGQTLTTLIQGHVDEALMTAVAAKHARGGRLYVATANLDDQEAWIWDMGAIAGHGGEAARQLFIDVLVASSSLPGLFPPALIKTRTEDDQFEEMHVDGGNVTPLFLVPQALSSRGQGWGRARAEIHALVNIVLDPPPQTTPLSAMPILARSFELILRSSYKSALREVRDYCRANRFPLHIASIDPEVARGILLRFDAGLMKRIFAHGEERATAGKLWD